MPAQSRAEQQAAAIALKAKEKGTTKGLKGPAKAMSKMSTGELKKFASTKHKGLPKHVKHKKNVKESYMPGMQEEMMQDHWEHPGCEDNIGHIFVVLKPTPESSPQDLVHQAHAFSMGQFEPQGVHGIYGDEEEANLVAEAACNELHKHLRKVEKKKDHVIGELDKHITRLQKEINSHMQEATDKPEESEMHHQLAEKKMGLIRGLRERHKMVKAAKKEIKPLEEKEKLKESLHGGEVFQIDNPSEYAIYWLQKYGKLDGSSWLPKAGVNAEKGLASLKNSDNIDGYHVKGER